MNKLLAYIGLFISATIWSLSFVAIDHCLEYMSPLEINVIRFSIGALFLWVVYLIRGVKMAFDKRDHLKIAIAGILGTAGYYHLTNLSMTYISTSVVSITRAAVPILTLIIAMLFMKKRTRFRNIVYTAMSFVGIVILTNPLVTEVNVTTFGVGVAMMGNLSWVIYTLINEPLTARYDKLNLLTIQMFYGAVVLVIIYWYQVATDQVVLLNPNVLFENNHVVIYLLFISIFSSVIAYHLYNYALDKVGVMLSALFINIIPVATLIIAVAVGVETFSFNKIVGCVLAVLAVYLIDDI